MYEDSEALNPQVVEWLLEPENPSVRYFTLVDLLEHPANDPDVTATKAAIPQSSTVASIFAARKPAGYWGKSRDYYIPKHYSTFWVLSILGDLGLTSEDERIREGCEFMFSHQREDGVFRRQRHIPGSWGWERNGEPCTHARIVRFLIQFGYADDPRTQAAIDWLIQTQRGDGGWLCARSNTRHACLRATLDYLRAAVLLPDTWQMETTQRAAEFVAALLMEPNMGHYHVSDAWTVLQYPYFNYGVLPALSALTVLGYGRAHPKIAKALDWLLDRRQKDGTWTLDEEVFHPQADFGRAGKPNKYITLDALRVFKSVFR